MKVTSSYKVKIINVNNVIDDTIKIYRKALKFYSLVIYCEWDSFKDLTSKERVNLAEKLTHRTKQNPNPSYDFSIDFYKYPSYLRRSTISEAIGIVSSYFSNLENYEKDRYNAISNGRKFKKKRPKLNFNHFKCPVLFKDNMFNMLEENKAQIKIYKFNKKSKKGNANERSSVAQTGDWIWLNVNLREQDLKYICYNTFGQKQMSPTLVKKGKKAYLKFPFEKDVKLNKTKLKEQKVCAIDLGLNHSAVCSIIDYNGTVSDRLFINQPLEKDRVNRLLTVIKRKQKYNKQLPKHWAKVNSLNLHLVNDTVNKIIKFALKNKVDVLVFEHLNFKGKKSNRNKAMQLTMWKHRVIAQKLKHNAHKFGMRYSQVNAKNTSALAFDGSGYVKRDEKNASLCVFPSEITPKGKVSYRNGKQYNCDLNASYNIGARYFIKKIWEELSDKKKSQLEAKVPQVGRRTQCTLSTLKLIVA